MHRILSSRSSGLSSCSSVFCYLTQDPLYLLFLQCEIKSCALAGQPFRPDCASVAVDNTPDRSQTDSRARIFFNIMQALKRSKYSLRVFHVEAGSVITNKIY